MILVTIPFLALVLMQDPAPAESARAVLERTREAAEAVERPQERDRTAFAAYNKARHEIFDRSLANNAELLSTGDGLYYRGQILLLKRDMKGALQAFRAHAKLEPKTELTHDSLMLAATYTVRYGAGKQQADKLFEQVDLDCLIPENRRLYHSYDADQRRAALTGTAVPMISIEEVVNGPEDLSFDDFAGRVLLIDFWATWCPPCRAVIPRLVEMQEKHGDELQVVGVTRFYGYGMDFADPEATVPHGGKSEGSRIEPIAKEREIMINENFAKAFALNYPIVLTGPETAVTEFGVRGIPTVFVIDREGMVLGHVVGGGEENHARLEELVARGLAGGNAAESAAPTRRK